MAKSPPKFPLAISVALIAAVGAVSLHGQDKKPTVVTPPPAANPPASAGKAPLVKPTAAPAPIQPGATVDKPLQITDFDSDKSGEVSSDEFLAYHAERLMKYFDILDADKNGTLTQDELARIQRRVTTIQGPRSTLPSVTPPSTVKVEPSAKPGTAVEPAPTPVPVPKAGER